MLLLYSTDLSPIVNPVGCDLPVIGRYISKIVDAFVAVVFSFDGTKDLCLVIDYYLTSEDGGEEYDFRETYCLQKGNHRIENFDIYLMEHGFDVSMEEDLIGICEEIEITYEFLGGFAYPLVCKREFIGVASS